MCILLLAALIFGWLAGYSMAAGYYAGLVRRAFGLGDEIVVHGWLKTKAIKRGLDAQERKG